MVDDIRTGTFEDIIRLAWIAAGVAGMFGVWWMFNRIRGDKESDQRAQLQSKLESQTSAYRVVEDLRSRRPWPRGSRRVR